MVPTDTSSSPEWTRLGNRKCENCTLKDEEHSHCPVAVNIANLVEDFKDTYSHLRVQVMVEVKERYYFKKTDVQTGMQSLFGVIMAVSGCPILDNFRSMARFHIPFASVEDHMVRTTAFHLMQQLIRYRRGEEASFDLEGLQAYYEEVTKVNVGFAQRIATAAKKDSSKNAMIGLHTIGELIGMEIGSSLETIESFFE